MSKIKLSGKQLADVLSISPQAVAALTKRERIVRDETGLFNLKDPVNRDYLKSKNIDIHKIIIPENKLSGRPTIARSQGNIKSAAAGPDKSLSELNKEKVIKQIEKLKIENQYKRGQLLDAQLVNDYLFLFLDKVDNNLQRNAMAFLSDNSNKIVIAGGVTSQIKNEFKNLISDQLDMARNETVKRIQKIQELQK